MFKIPYLRATIILSLLWLGNVSQAAGLPIVEEYQVKSVFLFNFAKFIKWPNTVFSDSQAPFYICIIGEDPFKQAIDITIENESIRGHSVLIERLDNVENSESCQILFISQSEENNLASIFKYLQQFPVLTVSDMDSFAEQGGMIQFVKLGKKIRLLINPEKAKAAGLQISANLLRVAKIFHSH